MCQLDVKTTFLNGFLEEDIYMTILEGLSTPTNPKTIYELFKSLYGLKQSLWAWYQCLDNHLVFQGFQRLESNVNIYIKKQVSF
jgi:hypothetical protein